ncbi:MAG: hypothetical protein ACOYLS_12710 [Polymorphobacter sp.]
MSIAKLVLMTLALSATVPMTDQSPLLGVWIEVNGPGAARIEPCKQMQDRLCAIGLARRAKGQPGLVDDGIVLSDLKLDGTNRWRGSYHDGKRLLPATVRFMSSQVVEMKVCILVICQSARYTRAA